MTSFCTGHLPTKYDRNYITLVERLLYKNEELKKLYFMDFWSVTVAIKNKPKAQNNNDDTYFLTSTSVCHLSMYLLRKLKTFVALKLPV